MSLNARAKLGPCDIVAPIGAGGTGDVYRAADTSLKCRVAIRVRPAAVAADAERIARLQRDARSSRQ